MELHVGSKIIFFCFKTAAHCSSVRLGETTVLRYFRESVVAIETVTVK